MIVDVLLFVSKRASAAAAALICLMAIHLAGEARASSPAPATEVRVAIAR